MVKDLEHTLFAFSFFSFSLYLLEILGTLRWKAFKSIKDVFSVKMRKTLCASISNASTRMRKPDMCDNEENVQRFASKRRLRHGRNDAENIIAIIYRNEII